LRSPDVIAVRRTPLRPLLLKELRGIVSGRALWTMLLIMCPIVGFSFFQAVSLYGEASASASDQAALASGLSPLDGILVPTFGAFYVTVTLLFPFVAIRALGREKETGTLRLLVQLPYRTPTLIVAKAAAVASAWLIAFIPAVSALVLWWMLGGHLHAIETANLLLGHLLYGLLIGAVALFAAAITESAATAAIVTLAVTIGSWILDFSLAGLPGLAEWVSRVSLTQTLRPFEQGLFSPGLALGSLTAIMGLATLAALWLHPGVPIRAKLIRSLLCVAVMGAVMGAVVLLAAQARTTIDVTEDRRNSFPAADQRALATLREPLVITVHLASEDPRYVDLRRNVLSKLERVLPNVTIRLVASQTFIGRSGDDSYGEVEYAYAGRIDKSRSTSHREILPLLYGLAQVPVPTPVAGDDYPGYPLVANAALVLPWFFGALPLLIALAWWRSRRAPRTPLPTRQGGES
jgi:ABC-type transport system involved in multi-copper enzyme maturation permease subunit